MIVGFAKITPRINPDKNAQSSRMTMTSILMCNSLPCYNQQLLVKKA